MTSLAVDPRLDPDAVIGVGVRVVIGGQLGDVAAVAGCVEGELGIAPVERLVFHIGKVSDHAGGRVVPFAAADVEGERQHLEAPALERRQEEVDVLPAHRELDAVLGRGGRPDLDYPPGVVVGLEAVSRVANRYTLAQGSQLGRGQLDGERLHGEAVTGRSPELVESLVAATAGERPLVTGGRRRGLAGAGHPHECR